MRIGVPTGTRCQTASISAFVTAMQPSVQSIREPGGVAPWIMMSPPGSTPRAAACRRSASFG